MNNVSISDRYVVFLDIMGFKDRVARNTHEKLYEELVSFNRRITSIISSIQNSGEGFAEEAIEEEGNSATAIELTKQSNRIILSQFSDSIILFSSDDTPESLEQISKATMEIMKAAFDCDRPIPIKGALAKGIVTCDERKQLYFGQALIDAYLLEENVQYYGIVVHHSAEEQVRDNQSDIFRDIEVPLKSGRIRHYELVWYKENKDDMKNGLSRLRLSVSDSPRKYVDNTNLMLKSLQDERA